MPLEPRYPHLGTHEVPTTSWVARQRRRKRRENNLPYYIMGRVHSVRVVSLGTHKFSREKEIFIDNLLVRIHLIIEMIIVDRPCAMGV